MWSPPDDIGGVKDTPTVGEGDGPDHCNGERRHAAPTAEGWRGRGDDEELRSVWVWVHVAAADEALLEIRKACMLRGAPWVGSVEVGNFSVLTVINGPRRGTGKARSVLIAMHLLS